MPKFKLTKTERKAMRKAHLMKVESSGLKYERGYLFIMGVVNRGIKKSEVRHARG